MLSFTVFPAYMDIQPILAQEEGLDPQDWTDIRQLGHQMLDDMMDYLENIGTRPVWTKPSDAARAHLQQPLPLTPTPLSDIYADFQTHILPYNKGNVHPRFWSWVQGTGSPFAMLADMLASGMNPNTAIGDHAAMYVEQQVLGWCKAMLGFPETGSGLLVSGGSLANITALIVARNAFGERRIRQEGVLARGDRLALYTSTETHACVTKAAEVMGLGSQSVRLIPVDAQFRMRTDLLRQRIAADRAQGFTPFCVVGNAGTVNTGAIDPLETIWEICQTENLWFHVDGAFGALAKLTPEYRDALMPIEKADSLAFDLHKWMYLPYEIGCVLVRDAAAHRAAFASEPSYLVSHERGLAAGPDPMSHYGLELSRGFKALKVWMSFQEHGIEKLTRLIRQNIAQAFYLGECVASYPDLELLTPVTMNLVCFRYHPEGTVSENELNRINQEILMQLHEKGFSAPSYTMLNGRYAIRVANVNHRSRKADFAALAEDVAQLGRAIWAHEKGLP